MNFDRASIHRWVALIIFAFITIQILVPLTRFDAWSSYYLSVAWGMWSQHQWIFPILNGRPYVEKTPFLFWLIILSWKIFGVNYLTARIIISSFFIGCGLLMVRMAKYLFPNQEAIAYLSFSILYGFTFWSNNIVGIHFDILLTFFVLLCAFGLLKITQQQNYGWTLFSVAMGIGLLVKGPVLYVFTLPIALLAPFWSEQTFKWRNWYSKVLLSLLISVVPLVTWIIACVQLGATSWHHLLFFETVDRIKPHGRQFESIWFYIINLPILLLPWFLYVPFLKGIFHWKQKNNKKIRFLLLQSLLPFMLFMLIGQKSLRYLLPLYPFVAILFAAMLIDTVRDSPKRWHQSIFATIFLLIGILFLMMPIVGPRLKAAAIYSMAINKMTPYCYLIATIVILIAIFVFLFKPRFQYQQVFMLATTSFIVAMIVYMAHFPNSFYNVAAFGRELNQAQKQGAHIAYLNLGHTYINELNYEARYRGIIWPVWPQGLQDWVSKNKKSYIFSLVDICQLKSLKPKPIFAEPNSYKTAFVLWRASQLKNSQIILR